MAPSGRRAGRSAPKRATSKSEKLENRPIDAEEEDNDVAMPDVADAYASDAGGGDQGDDDDDEVADDAGDESQQRQQGDGDGDDDVDDDDDDDEEQCDDDGDDAGEDGGDAGDAGDDRDDRDDRDESGRKPTPPPVPIVIRRKRPGRPPKIRPPDSMGSPSGRGDPDATPRRRGRGGWRGRGGRKNGPAPTKATQVIDKDGTVADIVDDECVLPEDPEGETKVDKLGNLQGGREYRCRTFTVAGRGERLYMLSTEPARCVGFRDSYLFFTKHLRLFKIIANDDEKRDMIERDIIPHSYKGRAIGIVTARSVFREFGARMIVGGRRITDDYAVADARAEGAIEGAIADPSDKFVDGQPYNKNQYVAWHGASSVYHQPAPAAPAGPVKVEVKKRRVNVNDTNWMLEHAREASVFNSRLCAIRKENLAGLYDIHTNTIQMPAHVQPTRAVFEPVVDDDEGGYDRHDSEGAKNNNINDINNISNINNNTAATTTTPTIFPKPDAKMTRNHLVLDIYHRGPGAGLASAAYEQPYDDSDPLAPFRGLSAVSAEIRALLPPACRAAFDSARVHEIAWRTGWDEARARERDSRRALVIDRTVQPYSIPLGDV